MKKIISSIVIVFNSLIDLSLSNEIYAFSENIEHNANV